MVETIKCDHCGAEARRIVTREFDGKQMNFCCLGCLSAYELVREEIRSQQPANDPGGNRSSKKWEYHFH